LYNQNVNRATSLFALAIFALGCGKNISNNDAVKQGVVDYLNKRMSQTGLDMNLMNVEVSSVKFDKDEAHATVSFRPKGSTPSAAMTMNYTLERQGSKWVVKGRQDSGLNPHGAGGPMTGGEAPMQPATPLPPNHPPVESAQPESQK
jgi:hypothetical protein